jgi:hypothetical protein
LIEPYDFKEGERVFYEYMKDGFDVIPNGIEHLECLNDRKVINPILFLERHRPDFICSVKGKPELCFYAEIKTLRSDSNTLTVDFASIYACNLPITVILVVYRELKGDLIVKNMESVMREDNILYTPDVKKTRSEELLANKFALRYEKTGIYVEKNSGSNSPYVKISLEDFRPISLLLLELE